MILLTTLKKKKKLGNLSIVKWDGLKPNPGVTNDKKPRFVVSLLQPTANELLTEKS